MYAKLHSTLTFMFQSCACGDYKRKYYQVRSKYKTCTITIYYRELRRIHEKSHMEWNNLLCIKIIFVLLFIKLVSNKGLMKIRNIEISENFRTLLSGKCCSKLCKCNVIFQVCLTPYNFEREICIIKAMSDSIMTPDSNEVDVTFSSTYSVSQLNNSLPLRVDGSTYFLVVIFFFSRKLIISITFELNLYV